MDFLEIRRRAKERAAARGAEPAPSAAGAALDPAAALAQAAQAGGSPGVEPGGAPGAEPRPALPAGPPEPVPEAPAPEEAAPEPSAGDETRFTTWRPGSGPRPLLEEPGAAAPTRAPAGSAFVTYTPGADRPLASVAPPLEPAPAAVAVAEPRSGGAPLDPELWSALRAATSRPPSPPPPPPDDPLDEFFYRPGEDAPAAAALGLAVADVPAERGEAALEEYLTFRLGEEEYAVAIERVREVLKPPPITEVPRAPADVLGVITVRGEVIAVHDPRLRLGLAPADRGGDRIIIVDAGQGSCGLLVDAVTHVVRLRPGSIEPRPQGIGGASADHLVGIGRDGDRLFTVIDAPALLRRAPPRLPGRPHAGP